LAAVSAKLAAMTATSSGVAADFVTAIAERDLVGAAALLHPEISFRAMTPNRVWEAATPGDVETVLREWFADPGEEVERIDATEAVSIEDVTRVGWLVWISDAERACVFEQQAYTRERDGQIDWMRVICSGWRPRTDLPAV